MKSSCITRDLENEVLLNTGIFMQLYIKDLEIQEGTWNTEGVRKIASNDV